MVGLLVGRVNRFLAKWFCAEKLWLPCVVAWVVSLWYGITGGSAMPTGFNFAAENYRAYAVLGGFDPIVNQQMMQQSLESGGPLVAIVALYAVGVVAGVLYVCTRR